MRKAVCRPAIMMLVVTVLCAPMPVWAFPTEHGETSSSSVIHAPLSDMPVMPPNWLEPRGLNIVDLVGWVPDSDLVGAIVQYTPGYGILRYVSGSRLGNTVTITATAYPRFYSGPRWSGSLFGCLGQAARADELGSVTPETRLHVYAPTGQEITRQVDGYFYVPAGLKKPIRNPHEAAIANQYRYEETGLLAANVEADGALLLPANMGCELLLSNRDYRELTLVFEAEVVPVISIAVLGRQTFQFPVYYGPGSLGHLEALRNQLARTCTAGSPMVADMIIPSGTNYLLFNYPPVPADPYTAFPHNPLGNVDRPTGAAYRVRTPRGLSVDHVISSGLPLLAHWVEMDQASGAQYLPYSSQVVAFEGLESILPDSFSYDSCMVSGGCSAALLAQICSTVVPTRMIYLRVDRIHSELSRIPLRMTGPTWRASGTVVGPAILSGPAPSAAATPGMLHRVYLVSVTTGHGILEPDDPVSCGINGGCGWFTSDGRMVDYIPLP